jgi:hypothetical protein
VVGGPGAQSVAAPHLSLEIGQLLFYGGLLLLPVEIGFEELALEIRFGTMPTGRLEFAPRVLDALERRPARR